MRVCFRKDIGSFSVCLGRDNHTRETAVWVERNGNAGRLDRFASAEEGLAEYMRQVQNLQAAMRRAKG